jgi:hypothetical protein
MQTATALSIKMQAMSPAQQREVYDFADFLVSRKKRERKQTKQKAHLLSVSVWSEDDIQAIANATVEVNKWNLPSY